MSDIVKGYKVFDPDWKCRGFQYEVGKEYHLDGEVELCARGFHFCRFACNCFNYYDFDPANKVAEVEASGLIGSDGHKYVTNHIRIVHQLQWKEVLELVNIGTDCTGYGNVGVSNTGKYNTGNYNTGDCNSGAANSGMKNCGYANIGDYNSGHFNEGCFNTGVGNEGNYNVGNWNKGDFNTGFFNTNEPFARCFNQPTNIRISEFFSLPGIQFLLRVYSSSPWCIAEDMTDLERTEHPEWVITKGYLKPLTCVDVWKTVWNILRPINKKAVLEIPNFDADIFLQITGIDVRKDKDLNRGE